MNTLRYGWEPRALVVLSLVHNDLCEGDGSSTECRHKGDYERPGRARACHSATLRIGGWLGCKRCNIPLFCGPPVTLSGASTW